MYSIEVMLQWNTPRQKTNMTRIRGTSMPLSRLCLTIPIQITNFMNALRTSGRHSSQKVKIVDKSVAKISVCQTIMLYVDFTYLE